jgi:hypothetical protein
LVPTTSNNYWLLVVASGLSSVVLESGGQTKAQGCAIDSQRLQRWLPKSRPSANLTKWKSDCSSTLTKSIVRYIYIIYYNIYYIYIVSRQYNSHLSLSALQLVHRKDYRMRSCRMSSACLLYQDSEFLTKSILAQC